MKRCDGCKYADWQKTANGRLHPSKQGRCTFKYSIPPLPQSRYFLGGLPAVYGGQIERGRELRDHCAYYAPAA